MLTCASSSCVSAWSSRCAASSSSGRCAARALEPLAQPQLQLAGRFLGERHRDDLADLRAARGEDADDPLDQLRRLAGAGRGFDDEGRRRGRGDEGARLRSVSAVVGPDLQRRVMASPSARSDRRAARAACARRAAARRGRRSAGSRTTCTPARPGPAGRNQARWRGR